MKKKGETWTGLDKAFDVGNKVELMTTVYFRIGLTIGMQLVTFMMLQLPKEALYCHHGNKDREIYCFLHNSVVTLDYLLTLL